MKSKQHEFSTFPEFTELTLADREEYNKLIEKYPPISEISFSTLMTSWSALDNCKIAILNDNVVISYWLPGDEKNSGLSLVGVNKIDESICEIFDYIKAKEQDCKLVHVPEFTLANINYPNMYKCKEESDFTESIIPIEPYVNLNKASAFVGLKTKKFLRATKNKAISLKTIDVSKQSNRDLIIDCYYEWQNKKHILIANKLPKHNEGAFLETIKNGSILKQEVLSLFIGDDIHAFTVIEASPDNKYKTIKYSGFSCEIPGLYEFSRYKLAERFFEENSKYVNIVIHIGDPRYKVHRLALNPVNAFRKYTVEPK